MSSASAGKGSSDRHTPCICSSGSDAGICSPLPLLALAPLALVLADACPPAFLASAPLALMRSSASPAHLHSLLLRPRRWGGQSPPRTPCTGSFRVCLVLAPISISPPQALQLGGGWSSALSSRTSKVFEGVADHFAKHLVGQRIAGAGRKGKQLWVSSRTRTPSRSCMQGVRGNLPDFLARRRLLSSHCASAAWPPAVPRPRKGRLGNADASPIF